ncbi:MAG TPA: type II secretion system protein GspG [Desulfonatronum sp.]|nr:type II secretion system protein GspG [Desulfonatronum sp.]
MNHQRGFSLIELMIVVVILGLLATLLVPRIMDRPEEARVAKAMMDIRTLESALRLYRLDNGTYPTTEQGLAALVRRPESGPAPRNYRSGGYLEGDALPRDPWGNEYLYRSPGEQEREYEIISLGADGKEGGDGFAADLRSWELQ